MSRTIVPTRPKHTIDGHLTGVEIDFAMLVMIYFPAAAQVQRSLLVVWLTLALMVPVFARPAAAASDEGCLTASINGERGAQGARTLASHSGLVSIARRHSARMAEDQRYYHNTNLRNELPSGWRSEGENVGWATDCAHMHRFFMNSPSHRKNILNPVFNQVGVGVVVDSAGKLWVTEVFMESSGQGFSSDSDPALQVPEQDPAPAPPPQQASSPTGPAEQPAADVSAAKPSPARPAAQSKGPQAAATTSAKKTRPPSFRLNPTAQADRAAPAEEPGWEDDLVLDPVPIIFDLEPAD